MKSIIKNKDNYISKNDKSHSLHFYSYQEDIGHNKKESFDFESKAHHYYNKHYNHYYFNDFIRHENNS
jgi:hypothetical protein